MAKQTYKCPGCEGCASCNGDSAYVLAGQKHPEVKKQTFEAVRQSVQASQTTSTVDECNCLDPGDCTHRKYTCPR